jgi:predicted GH43/DUF377 family glycosyl hydrolase
MTNFLIYPEINEENGFPSEVNSAILNSSEAQAEFDEQINARKGIASGIAALDTNTKLLEANIPTRLGDAALNATYAGDFRDQADVSSGGTNLENYGLILGLGSGGTFDAAKVESPCVFFDKTAGRLAMLYTGYTTLDGTAVASHGIAYSDDGITWTKTGQFFTGSGVVGSPDRYGVTGPVLYEEAGTYHLFYIGLTALGYEGGQPTICHATATSLAGPWTRNGTIIAPSGLTTGPSEWREQYTWHPNVVKARNKYYMFFNATDSAGLERAGYAWATDLDGPWNIDDANAPILPDAGHTTDAIWGGDPFVYREDDHWRMEFANANPSWGPVGDWWATTTDALFPLGWVIGGQVAANAYTGMKPWITRWNGQFLHYATISTGITVSSAKVPRRFVHKSADNFDSSVIIGDNIGAATGAGRAKVSVGSTTGISEVIVGQDSTHNVLFSWAYNATVNNATAKLETYGGSNQINIQNNTGSVMVAGAGGKIGFYGTAPVVKPALTYSRATENAADTQLRTALVALGLVTDSTTA